MFTADFDVGGTFTDGFFSDGATVRTAKALTTPHDITEGLLNCLAMGAAAFASDPYYFYRNLGVCRISTTLGTNLLIQRRGPKVGLVVTAGFERTLYGPDTSPVLGAFLQEELVVGVQESVRPDGSVATPLDREQVLAALRELLQRGARMIAVSLANSWVNPVHERQVREFARERYPVHYLRSVPLQLGTEIAHVADDRLRTHAAVINAYIHDEMARALFKMEDRVRERGFRRPLLVVHATGGCARVAKTVALSTLNSGPAVAVRGAAVLARLLGLSRVITTDMGGTSLDVALVRDGVYTLQREALVHGVPLGVPSIDVATLGAGGGSIARVEGGVLRVGPESAGAAPGPACYDKGGDEPTVTDANVVLGFIDPGYFLGGRMQLNLNRAAQAIQRRVARPLGMSVPEAALAIREQIEAAMAAGIRAAVERIGDSPDRYVLFSFGGAGPLHACGVAQRLGIRRVYCFPFGSVFAAFGSSTADVQHWYMRTFPAGAPVRQVLAAVAEMREQAERDMAGEGFAPGTVEYALELGGSGTAVDVPLAREGWLAPVEALVARTVARREDPWLTVTLRAVAAVPHWLPQARPVAAREVAPRAWRPVYWSGAGATETPIYSLEALEPGCHLVGPAVVEAPDTNYVVAQGWELHVDEYGNLVLGRV